MEGFDSEEIVWISYMCQEQANELIDKLKDWKAVATKDIKFLNGKQEDVLEIIYQVRAICKLWKVFAVCDDDKQRKKEVIEYVDSWIEYANDIECMIKSINELFANTKNNLN